ncbi:MAG: prephenate dehydratase [Alphaproteobacteria bacterium]
MANPSRKPARTAAARPAPDRAALARLRARIDRIDDSILRLLVERFRVVEDVLRAKQRSGGAVYRPLREHLQLDRLEGLAAADGGPLSADAVRAVFGEILSASRALQGSPRVAYLGPEGTFSERAARAQFGSAARLVPVASIPEVFAAVERSRAQLGIVPIENSTEGMVGPTLDALVSSPLRIVAERGLAVRQALLSRSSDLRRIRRVVSHPQSLAQCRDWLSRRLPDVATIEVASNAAAAARAARSPSTAAIASRDAARRYGLQVLAEDIQDAAHNVTRFVVLAPPGFAVEAGADKMSILFSVRNRPGALFRALEPLARARVDLCKLESRPMRGRSWEYLFFVDLRGAIEGSRVRTALAAMERECILFKVLGAYAEARSA